MDDTLSVALGGDPMGVAKSLKDFQESAKVLSSNRVRLIDTYARQWVGVVRGSVVVSGETMGDVVSSLKAKGLDPNDAIVRYIDREVKTLIL